jgi:predicted kinase
MRTLDDKPAVYVFFGLIASGKSTLARAWAEYRAIEYFNSDVIRKQLAGSGSSGLQPFRQGIYSESFTRKTYAALLDRASAAIRAGRSVVLDASYQRRADRQGVRDLAKKHGARVYFILCSCPEDELKRRMAQRARDPQAVSDGRWEIYLHQRELFEEPSELTAGQLLRLATTAPVDLLVAQTARAFAAMTGE